MFLRLPDPLIGQCLWWSLILHVTFSYWSVAQWLWASKIPRFQFRAVSSKWLSLLTRCFSFYQFSHHEYFGYYGFLSTCLQPCTYFVTFLFHILGSSGPSSINPETGKPYGTTFPVLSVFDMVNAQFLLLDHLGIDKLYATVGSSLGEWC